MLRESTLADAALLQSYLRHCTPASHDAALRCLADLHTLRFTPSPFDMIHLCDALRLNVTLHTLVLGGLDDMGLSALACLRHPTIRHLTLFQTEWTRDGQESIRELLAHSPLQTCTVQAYESLSDSLTEEIVRHLSPTLECVCLPARWTPRLEQLIEYAHCAVITA